MWSEKDQRKPKVDVIIPTYNRENTIKRAVLSVLNQSYRNVHVYVIDDASKDGTEAVMETIQDDRVTYYKCKNNQGANVCRNIGIRMGQAEFVAFNDSDDVWHEDKLERQMNVMLNLGEDFGVVFCDYTYIGNNGISYELLKTKTNDYGTFPHQINVRLLVGPLVGTPSMLVRRSCFDEVGMFDEMLPRLQDWEMTLRLSKKYKFYCIYEALFDAYSSNNSISRNVVIRAKANIYIMKKYYKDYEANGFLSTCVLKAFRDAVEAQILNEFYEAVSVMEENVRYETFKLVEDELQRIYHTEKKMRANYQLACSWIEYQQHKGLQIDRFFVEQNVKKIAIYGYGKFGKILVENLAQSNDVCILAIIDNGNVICDLPYRVYHPDEFMNAGQLDIDMVVVTVGSSINSIREMLESRYQVICLEDVFN